MDLERNIYDTVKEWEIKIGYRKEALRLYYPEESLLELLSTNSVELPLKIKEFCCQMKGKLGDIEIKETEERGRYCVKIPPEGTQYIHKNISENVFLKALLRVITTPDKKLEDALKVFQSFSKKVSVDKETKSEWAVWFTDGNPDVYVYYIEEDAFGLEYHRFTKEAYARLKEEK